MTGRPSYEDLLQVATFNFLTLQAHKDVVFTHVANENRGSKKAGARAKAKGQLAGWPDWTILWDAPQYENRTRALFIELKAPNGTMSMSQREFQKRMEDAFIPYEICRSLDEFTSLAFANTAFLSNMPGVPEYERCTLYGH